MGEEENADLAALGKVLKSIQAELDAMQPKRWHCQIEPKDTLLIEPCAVRSGLVAVKIRESAGQLSASVGLLPEHAREAGYELIRLGGGEALDRAAVIALVNKHLDTYGDSGQREPLVMLIYELETGTLPDTPDKPDTDMISKAAVIAYAKRRIKVGLIYECECEWNELIRELEAGNVK
jgi:hypothetical protein